MTEQEPTRYEVWDTDSGNIVGAYPTEAEALASVRETIEQQGVAGVRAWSLGRMGDGEPETPVLEGPTLVHRALQPERGPDQEP